MKNLAAYRIHYRRLLILAYPIVLSQAGQMLTGIADNAMVGRVGAESLAAAAFANSVFINLLIFGMGFAYALTPLTGTAFARNDHAKVGSLLAQSLKVNVLLGIVLTAILLLLTPYLAFFGQPPVVLDLAKPYFQILILTLIPHMVFMTFKQFAEGMSVTKPAMVITLSGNLLNIFLNYILIYGKLGFPAMGLNGAGWATLIARGFMAVAMAWYVLKGKKYHQYVGNIWQKFFSEWGRLGELIKIGVPIGLQYTMEVGAFSFGAIMVGWVGKMELAAHQVALSLAALTFMTASGVAAATGVRVSNLLGAEKLEEVKDSVNAALHIVLTFMAMCGIGFLVFRHWLPTLFVEEQPVIEIAARLLIVAALFQVFDGLQVVAIGALRGLTDVRIPTLIAFVSYWVISLPVGYLSAFVFGFNEVGIWIGFCTGLGLAAVMLLMRFYYVIRKTGPAQRERKVAVG